MSVSLVGPDGREYHLETDDPAALAKARQYGYRTPDEAPLTGVNPEHYGPGEAEETAGAAARGALSGLTAGFVPGVAADESERRYQRTVNEEHPLIHGAAEFAGAVLSPVNKVAAPLEGAVGATSVAGRIGAKALGGAGVGSLFGAGSAVSDAALGDSSLTAEKLIASVGLGALLGGAGGGLGGAVEEAASGIVPKLGKLMGGAQSTLDDIADDAAVKSTRATQAEIQHIGEANVEGMGHMLRERGHLAKTPADMLESITQDREATSQSLLKQMGLDVQLPHGASQEEAQAAITKALDSHGEAIGDALKGVDESSMYPGGIRPKYPEVHKAINDFEAALPDPAARDAASGPLKKVREYLYEMGQKPVGSQESGFRALNSLKTSLARDINYGAESSAKVSAQKQLIAIIKNQIDSQLEAGAGAAISEDFMKAKRAYGLLSRGEDALGRKTSTGADAIAEMVKSAGLATPEAKLFEQLGHAQTLAGKGASRATGFGLKDIGAAVVGGGFHPGLGLMAGLASKFMREYGPAVVARAADAIAKAPALATAAQSMGAQVATVAPKLGVYGPQLLEAFSRGPAVGLATHMTMAQVDPGYAATAQLAGLAPEALDQHVSALGRASSLATVAGAMKAHDEQLDRHIDAVFRGEKAHQAPRVMGGQDFGAKRMRRGAEDAHTQRVGEIQAMAADPSFLVDKVAANAGKMAGVAPGITSALTARAHAAVQFLAQEAAAPAKAGPLAHEWTTPEADREAFAAKLEVVESPMSVMQYAAAGTLTEQQVGTLRAVYPQLAQDISERLLMKLAESPKHVPYSARLMINLLTGVDPDGSLSGESIAANQSAIAAAGKKQDAGQGSSGTPKQADSISLASRTATPSQRREMGEV